MYALQHSLLHTNDANGIVESDHKAWIFSRERIIEYVTHRAIARRVLVVSLLSRLRMRDVHEAFRIQCRIGIIETFFSSRDLRLET